MARGIEIKKSGRGYEVRINGKTVQIYVGSQDAELLHQEIEYSYNDLSRKLESEFASHDWWRRIQAGTAPSGFIDALIVFITAYLERRKSSRGR
jgi:uncharacterized PurR-regulated membrane protein YhhQ (DUF165 family)